MTRKPYRFPPAAAFVLLAAVAFSPRAGAADIIVDDGASTSASGSWTGFGDPACYNNGGLYIQSALATRSYPFTGLTAGQSYDVYASWSQNSNRTTAATYTVKGAGGTATLGSGTTNQTTAPADITVTDPIPRSIGFRKVVAGITADGTTATVLVSLPSGDTNVLIADAILLRPVSGPALAAGTASVSGTGSGTASLACTAASGGTSPYTYQWYRSTASGTRGSPVSGATSLTLGDSGLTNGTTYYYTLVVTDAASATAASNQVAATPAGAGVVVTPSSSGTTLVADPVWDLYNGQWVTSDPGRVTGAVSGTTTIELDFDVSALVAGSVPSNGYPIVAVSYSGAKQQTYQLDATGKVIVTGLTAGNTYGYELIVVSTNHNYDRWGANPVSAVKLTQAKFDAGAVPAAPTGYYAIGTQFVLVFSDSIGFGFQALGPSDLYTDSRIAWPRNVFAGTGYTAAVVSCPGQGVLTPGNGNVPAAANSTDPANQAWSLYRSGRSRLTAGKLDPRVKAAAVFLGKNDGGGASFQAGYAWLLGQLRAALPAAAPVLAFVPADATVRADITAAVNGYLAANPSDKTTLIDKSGVTAPGYAANSVDVTTHPDPAGHAIAAAAYAPAASNAINGAAAGVSHPINGGPIR